MKRLEQRAITRCLKAACLACVLASGCGGSPEDARTSVVLITLDTLRADHVGAYGSGVSSTRSLDALAAEGLVHENAYTTMPITGPAHLSLFTGLYPSEHGARTNGRALSLSNLRHNLVPRLGEAGYATAAFVATSLLDYRRTGLDGFDVYESPSSGEISDTNFVQPGDEVVNAALAWLGKEDRRPVFLWVHFYDAHAPYGAPADRPEGIHDWTGYGFVEPDFYPDTQSRERMRNLYSEDVRKLDGIVGRLIDGIRDQLSEPPLVIAVADHGETLDEHFETRGYAYDHGEFLDAESVRIPLVVAGPGVGVGRSAGTASIRDLYTTILEATGVGDPEADARNRRDLRVPSDTPRVLAIERRSARNESVREQHLLLWHAAAAASGGELVVVNEEGRATLGNESEALLKVARRHAKAVDRTGDLPEPDAATQRMLRELGYLD